MTYPLDADGTVVVDPEEWTITYRYRGGPFSQTCLCVCHEDKAVHLVGYSSCCSRAVWA